MSPEVQQFIDQVKPYLMRYDILVFVIGYLAGWALKEYGVIIVLVVAAFAIWG